MASNIYEGMNLYQKLAMLRKRVEVIQKTNPGYNYMYVSDTDLLARLTGGMDEAGVSLIPSVKPGTMNVTEHKADMVVSAEMNFRWVNNDDPTEYIDVPWVIVGQKPDSSQAFGSALTYSYRYFLLKFFGVATPKDDPDYWISQQQRANETETTAILQSTIKSIDTFVREKCAENEGFKEQMRAIAKKYISDGNYMKIRSVDVAVKMLEELNNTEFVAKKEVETKEKKNNTKKDAIAEKSMPEA